MGSPTARRSYAVDVTGGGTHLRSASRRMKEVVLAVASEVGAMVDIEEDGTVQASCFTAEEAGECKDSLAEWGMWSWHGR